MKTIKFIEIQSKTKVFALFCHYGKDPGFGYPEYYLFPVITLQKTSLPITYDGGSQTDDDYYDHKTQTLYTKNHFRQMYSPVFYTIKLYLIGEYSIDLSLLIRKYYKIVKL